MLRRNKFMKKIFILSVLFFITPIFSMQELNDIERKEIDNCIRQLALYCDSPNTIFRGDEISQEYCVNLKVGNIIEILNKHSIKYPDNITWLWLADLKKALNCKIK